MAALLLVSACATHRSGYETAQEIGWYEQGYAEAQADIAQGRLQIRVPSSPPVPWVYQHRVEALAEFGIDWVLTGDVLEIESYTRQHGYNAAIWEQIAKQFGEGFLDAKLAQIEQEIALKRANQRVQ